MTVEFGSMVEIGTVHVIVIGGQKKGVKVKMETDEVKDVLSVFLENLNEYK